MTNFPLVRGKVGVSRDMVVDFVKLVEEHNVHPVIAKTFEFNEAPEAFECLRNQKDVGKIVIKIGA